MLVVAAKLQSFRTPSLSLVTHLSRRSTLRSDRFRTSAALSDVALTIEPSHSHYSLCIKAAGRTNQSSSAALFLLRYHLAEDDGELWDPMIEPFFVSWLGLASECNRLDGKYSKIGAAGFKHPAFSCFFASIVAVLDDFGRLDHFIVPSRSLTF